jgi:uncharacterized OB-fold protein
VSPDRLAPPVSALTAPFWDATREQRLLLQWCRACERPVFYPREVCPVCLSTALEWRESPGEGTVYAVTVEHRAQQPGLASWAPYAVALVELDEGVRMLTNVIGIQPDRVAIGQRVAIAWEPLQDGRHLPVFEPREGP